MQLHQVTPRVKNKKSKRIGRGTGSGSGKTSGRGHKGAGQRTGSKRYIGHEGGNVPYLRRIPKRGFTAIRHKSFQVVNISSIVEKLKNKKEITPKELKEVNLIRDEGKPTKILAKVSDLKLWAATFKADKFSKKAIEVIEAAGGKIECLKR